MKLRLMTIRWLLIVGVLVVVIVVFQCCWTTYKSMLDADGSSGAFPVAVSISENSENEGVYRSTVNNVMVNLTFASRSEEYASEKEADLDHELESNRGKNSREGHLPNKGFKVGSHEDAIEGFTQKRPKYALVDDNHNIQHNVQFASQEILSEDIKILDAGFGMSDEFLVGKEHSTASRIESVEMEPQLLEPKMDASSNRSKLVWPTSMTHMSSLLQSFNSASMRPRWSSRPDRELFSAKLEIENARVISNSSELYAPVFLNVSKFSRSYALMERKLKVFVYREGEKPIFHQPKMRGIYASEGWFMKLMEGNKRFSVKDPRKAHLFYLPFSSQILRATLPNQKQMEQYLEKYVELIAGKYRFWNRTDGADHFLVACHDWASQITRQPMKGCIRSLCNSNAAKGFQIGKDTTLPVTYIHSVMNPLREFVGKPPSERSILAFFAGNMHGYLRPILLKHWKNKEPDMKIFGPMPRDLEGKKLYMEYMNSSKYCICARGHEVHTPRIIEAIFSECVPVIISDNYVPPFFEVLNWEAFSVFVLEKDIPSLRNMLLSISEEKYLALHFGVKKVRQHFLWHKVPVKYDLFHMILHAVWNNRLSQIRPR
ncbi:probable glycosyltransferase At3g07620 [Vigna umbellata]|uniref:probable glycosyltransferase At3g07620 n=1 Tax=Vigna umbellata TaxID=87088 RepID=UPI001F5F4881|nr:probable glycosyltransferase At3g07620 [Vigna umbellata]